MAAEPPRARPGWRAHRIVPSHFPPIQVFEAVVSQDEFEIAAQIESMTNDRLRDETGDISLVPPAERVFGPGASPVMAAFTHIGQPSRFTDGSYGVYYAASSLETAIRETVFHRERFLAATSDPPMELTMRCYIGEVLRELLDIRGAGYEHLHEPDIDRYGISQQFAAGAKARGADGLLYRSVRHPAGECIAAFRPKTVSRPCQGQHLRYVWDGQRITDTFEIKDPFTVTDDAPS